MPAMTLLQAIEHHVLVFDPGHSVSGRVGSYAILVLFVFLLLVFQQALEERAYDAEYMHRQVQIRFVLYLD